MSDDVLNVLFRPLNILRAVEGGAGVLRIPALLLHDIREGMQRVDIGKTFSSQCLKKIENLRRVLAVELQLYRSIIVDMYQNVGPPLALFVIAQIVPEGAPIIVLPHAPRKRGFLRL